MPGKPASRLTDMHQCPAETLSVPHVGGPILAPGWPTVMIGGLIAARVSDQCVCVGYPDVIVMGAFTTLIGSMPAARMGDQTAHGGTIVFGWPTVLIGDAPTGSPAAMAGAAKAAATSKQLVADQTADAEEKERRRIENEQRAQRGEPPLPPKA